MMALAPSHPSTRLQRLIGFIDRDPTNTPLLADAISLALDERQIELACELAGRIPEQQSSPQLLNLKAIVALAQQRFQDAIPTLERLRSEGADAPAIRFNLAWAKMMTGDFVGADALLDDQAVATSPRGPSLKIQAMHHQALYEEALAKGKEFAERYPDDTALMGSLATLAMDAENGDLALHYAQRSGENSEGLSALGMMVLDKADTVAAVALFDRAIAGNQHNPRAWIGKGLGLMAVGDNAGGAVAIDRGAELFKDHLGSWIASGWAHFVNGEYGHARASFERAMDIDPNFAENHGGLAVLDIIDGSIEGAERHCQIALRLDRQCFGGALARSMLLEKRGKAEAAQKVRDIAMSTPIGPDGRTIMQTLVGFGMRGPR